MLDEGKGTHSFQNGKTRNVKLGLVAPGTRCRGNFPYSNDTPTRELVKGQMEEPEDLLAVGCRVGKRGATAIHY